MALGQLAWTGRRLRWCTGRTPIWSPLSRERSLFVPDFAGFFDSPPRINGGRRFFEASQRPAGTSVGEKTSDGYSTWIARALRLVFPSVGLRPADAPYPYQTVSPDWREAGRDSGAKERCLCPRQLEAVDRAPRRRSSLFPWSPSIHTGSSSHGPTQRCGWESQFVSSSAQGQSRRFKSFIFIRIV